MGAQATAESHDSTSTPHNAPSTPAYPLCPQVAALAALSNLPYIERVRDALVAERGRLFDGLQAVPFLQASAAAQSACCVWPAKHVCIGAALSVAWQLHESKCIQRYSMGQPAPRLPSPSPSPCPSAALPLPLQLHPVQGDGREGCARPQGCPGQGARHHGPPLQVCRGRAAAVSAHALLSLMPRYGREHWAV